MRIGIVSIWLNRGQSAVSKRLTEILQKMGHEVHFFVRPPTDSFTHNNSLNLSVPGAMTAESVTFGTAYNTPQGEYLFWAKEQSLEVVFFDQNYNFQAIESLKDYGVTTIGRFVWESFDTSHAQPARAAYSQIYGLTKAECDNYAKMGLDVRYVSWSVDDNLKTFRRAYDPEGPMVFIGGWMSARKPLGSVLQAWALAENRRELIVKTQRPIQEHDICIPDSMERLRFLRKNYKSALLPQTVEQRFGVRVITSDLESEQYFKLLSTASVLVCPSRWEGLGVHFFESMALGIPVITSAIEPITEFVTDGVNGLTTESRGIGTRLNGLAAYEPIVRSLKGAFERLDDSDYLRHLSSQALEQCDHWTSRKTMEDLRALLEQHQ